MLTPLRTHLIGFGRITCFLAGLLLAVLHSVPSFAQGIITTVAGTGLFGYGFGGDGGPATAAKLFFPNSVAVDGQGNLFIGDLYNQRVRKVDAQGTITTVAGNGSQGYSGDNGLATAAQLNNLTGVAVDGQGNLFIADRDNNRIRKVDKTTGRITTVAGDGNRGYGGDGGSATAAQLNLPSGVAVDGQGNLFIAEQGNNRIRKVDKTTGTITTVAGNGTIGYSVDGTVATSAQLGNPVAVAVDAQGNLFIADQGNRRVSKVNAQGILTTVAGNGSLIYNGDNRPATAAGLYSPSGVAVDGQGNLFIADQGDSRIRKVDKTTGTITTVAGTGKSISSGISADGGLATATPLDRPIGVAVDGQGNIFIADQGDHRIRKVSFNLPPIVVGSGLTSPQSATAGLVFETQTAYAFSDPEGRGLTFSSNSLPNGLSINPTTGVIAGTPVNVGTAGVTVVATDGAGSTVSSGFILNLQRSSAINVPPQVVGRGLVSPQSATVGVALTISTSYAFFDTENYPLRYLSNSLPTGLQLDAITGLITGTPVHPGTVGITVGAVDDVGSIVYSGFFLNIQSGLVVVGSGIISPQSATVGAGISIPTAYAFADPSGRPLRYASSPLPAGLSLDPNTGIISGTPINPGTAGITVVATSETNVTVYSGFYLNIVLDPSVNLAPRVVGSGISSPQSGTVGVAFSTPTAYAFSDPEGRPLTYSSSSLPDGLSINPSTGVISGTPSRAYTFGVTVGATDDGGSTVYSGFFVTIVNPGGGRVGGLAEAGQGLQVRVLGNPVAGEAAQLEIMGAAGQSVWLRSYDQQGRLLGMSTVEQAGERERTQVGLGSAAGLYYVQVGTAGQQQMLKVLKR